MTGFVLDVATLRGATNLLRGKPRTDGGSLVDLDITALGTLLEAICFGDEVVVPDLGHRFGSQLVTDTGEAIRHVAVGSAQRDTLVSDAFDWLGRHCDLDSLVAIIGAQPTLSHVGWGSETFYLLQALGVKGKYTSTVVQAILGQDGDRGVADHEGDSVGHARTPRRQNYSFKRWGAGPTAEGARLDRIIAAMLATAEGARSKKNAKYSHHWIVDPQLESFATNLVWTLLRARCYLVWAHDNAIPYMPHPLRARLAGYAAAVGDTPNDFVHYSERVPFAELYLERLASVHREGVEAVAEISNTTLLHFPFPTILPYIVKRAGARERMLEVAYEVRDSRGARSVRKHVSDFEGHVAAGDLHAAIRLREELERLTGRLREDLGLVRRRKVATTLSVGIPGASLKFSGPGSPGVVGQVAVATADRLRRPWLVLMRDVFDALASASSLGRLYEVVYPSTTEEL